MDTDKAKAAIRQSSASQHQMSRDKSRTENTDALIAVQTKHKPARKSIAAGSPAAPDYSPKKFSQFGAVDKLDNYLGHDNKPATRGASSGQSPAQPQHSSLTRKRSESPNKMLSDEFQLDKVTPEMAAKIVKHFILPMFDNAPSSKYGKRVGKQVGNQGAIYEELKLSDKLNSMLVEVKDEVQSLTENLEHNTHIRREAVAQYKQLQIRFEQKSKETELLKTQLLKQVQENRTLKQFVD